MVKPKKISHVFDIFIPISSWFQLIPRQSPRESLDYWPQKNLQFIHSLIYIYINIIIIIIIIGIIISIIGISIIISSMIIICMIIIGIIGILGIGLIISSSMMIRLYYIILYYKV